jgi:poly-gamma-glutamate capsule biosynthesis protein CapA/YwtB (metallophosphatase superfamily)
MIIKRFVSFLIIFFICFICVPGSIYRGDSEIKLYSNIISLRNTTSSQGITLPKVLNENYITIDVAGDCTLGNPDSLDFRGSFIDVFEKQNNDYSYFFKNVKSIFSQDDLSIVNLETTLTEAADKMDKPFIFKGYPSFTNILKEGSIEVVNISNNHIHDYLQKGFMDTIHNLKNSNIGFFGEGYKYSKEIKGIKIGILGYRAWVNDGYLKREIKKDIRSLKNDGNDLVIVSFHWGDENQNNLNDIQKALGKYAVDNGADLVFGHHPHVIQGIEKYKGKYIVYSLGNFSFGGSRNTRDKDTFIFQEKFGITDGKLNKINKASVFPCSISSQDKRNNFQPTPLSGIDKDRVIIRLNNYSKYFNTQINKEGILN